MLAIRTGVPAHADQLGLDLADQLLFLVSFDDRQCTLKNVVCGRTVRTRREGEGERHTGKLVLHHGDDGADTILLGCDDLVYELSPTLRISRHERLLAHVRGKFMTRHVQHLTAKFGDDQGPILWLPMLQNELDHIVLGGRNRQVR